MRNMFKFMIVFAVYVAISSQLFPLVYEASKEVIDEQFHLRQGIHYCNGNFDVWDPKITTFPGLYIVSALFNYPLGTCTVWAMRLTSLLASMLNVWLIYQIRRTALQLSGAKLKSLANVELETLTIALLPPLYMFAHLFYTDVVSLSSVLAMMLFSMRSEHNWAAFFGSISVLMRQTNIVWVAMALGTTVIDKLVGQTLPFIKQNERYGRSDHIYSFGDILAVVLFYAKRFYLIPKQIKLLVAHLFGYVLVLAGFVGFVLYNGSIVVGDKDAHTASVHVPQLFYFALFVLIFGVAVWPPMWRYVLHDVYVYWIRTLVAVAAIGVIVELNTVEHPYLLADNRHYTFYVWNRFYAAHPAARFAIVPAYVFGLAAINTSLAMTRTAGFRLCLTLCTVMALCFQQLIEVRYFLVPFLYVRLHSSAVGRWWLAAELVAYAVLNAAVFYVFSTKEIWWDDFEAVQRLIW